MLTKASRSRDFPSLGGDAYLNTAAEGIPPACVAEAVAEYIRDKSLGMNGRDLHFARLERCRTAAAMLVGLGADEVAFCSCASEAYNLLASAVAASSGEEIVVSDLDFPAGATPWLADGRGATVRLWRSRGGALALEDLAGLLSGRTRVVQVSLVSFWNGFRLDWPAVREVVRDRAPEAILAVDLTQAAGRLDTLAPGADIVISSTHKWLLAAHGGCIVGVAQDAADRLTPRAGGWFHLANAFDADRFERVERKRGAAGFAVGMPNFAAIYALEAALSYLADVGIARIAAWADPLVEAVHQGLVDRGIEPMAPRHAASVERGAGSSGIVAFRHAEAARLHALCEAAGARVMHHAGRIRLALHGYNTRDDVDRFFEVLDRLPAAS
jgi:selenocysteine lyase/cysteine desulfurase